MRAGLLRSAMAPNAIRRVVFRSAARSGLALLAALGASGGALAQASGPSDDTGLQWGASLSVDTDYRFRGVSLNDERPSAHLGLAFDHDSGWYGGATLSAASLEGGTSQPQWLAYLGHARAQEGGPGWELGVLASHFAGASHYNYAEIYAGLTSPRWSARLYYSPDYFGRDWSSLYAELNGSLPLRESLRLFAHAGALVAVGTVDGARPSSRYDASVGLSLAMGSLQWQVAWVGSSANAGGYGQRRNTVVGSMALYF